MAQVSNKTLMMIIFVLSIVFIFTLLYGCSCTYEKFEVSGPAPAPGPASEEEPVTDQTMKRVSDQVQQEEAAKEEAAYTKAAEEVKQSLGKGPAPAPAAVRVAPSTSPAPSPAMTGETLNSKEKELFDQITSNNMSGEELNKLIAAGIVTEKMIEKFLNQLDMNTDQEMSEEKVEPFCSGECYATF